MQLNFEIDRFAIVFSSFTAGREFVVVAIFFFLLFIDQIYHHNQTAKADAVTITSLWTIGHEFSIP